MPMKFCYSTGLILFAIAQTVVANAEESVGKKAHRVFSKHCFRCHGENGSKEGGMDYILDAARLRDSEHVVTGNPKESDLLRRMLNGEMPPEDEPLAPSPSEIAIIEKWISEGAPNLEAEVDSANRKFIGNAETLRSVHRYLDGIPKSHRETIRFFSLTNLHNSNKILDQTLTGHRAALSKVLNSLSWKPIHVPDQIDNDEAVFAIDLRDYGWTHDEFWVPLTRKYPYGLKHSTYPIDLTDIANEVYEWTGTDIPVIRADWFVFVATRTPMYEQLLRLPRTVTELEDKLGVGRAEKIANSRAVRAGFVKSGVSRNNRLVERHDADNGYYWISYDFKSSSGKQNLIERPLGPGESFERRHGRFAFEFDGGEIIFSLPNGLQGYMVTDADGNRLDEPPPIEVVRDRKEVSGSPAVINGVSCMSCHGRGMRKDFKDEVRDSSPLRGDASSIVKLLYRPDAEMRKLLDKDETRFLHALEQATGELWRTNGETRGIQIFPEPIGPISKWYTSKGLDIDDVAVELGLKDSSILRSAIQLDTNQTFTRLGLGPLLRPNGVIKRDSWESLDRVVSRFQETSRLLKLGTPKVSN
ncbi:hypothetical protein OAH18_00415 [bacterium]|nr:hypothetical protein [bacterium]